MPELIVDSIIKPNYDLKILSLDIALANSGWCIYEFNTVNFRFRLRDFNTITTDVGESKSTRVRLILRAVTELISEYKINCVIIEEPPDTIYGGGGVNILKGRAAAIFGVVAACYSVVGFCYANGIFCREMYPTQWQANGDKNCKTWSIQEAKRILAYLKFAKQIDRKKDNHAADAINIGLKAINNFTNRKWVIPNVQHE